MKVSSLWVATGTLVSIFWCFEVAAEAKQLPLLNQGLSQAIDQALSQQPVNSISTTEPKHSSWLTSNPSLGLDYLAGSEGELALALSFEIKTGKQKQLSDSLQQAGAEMLELRARVRRLALSGLIREIVWGHEAAKIKRNFARRRLELLTSLNQHYSSLLAGKVISSYGQIRVEQELVKAKLELIALRQQVYLWRDRYQEATGNNTLPIQIEEPKLDTAQHGDRHPKLLLLAAEFSTLNNRLKINDGQHESWRVHLLTKQMKTIGASDRQYGIGIELPLTGLKVAPIGRSSEVENLHSRYYLQRDQLKLVLKRRVSELKSERSVLSQKASLYTTAERLAQKLLTKSAAFDALNEIGRELVLRQKLDAVNASLDRVLNQLQLKKNNVMQRQAAGISL